MTSAEVFMLFALAINHHDVPALSALMTPDHVFVDSAGQRVQGVEPMTAGWRGYFEMCPNYWIRADNVVSDGDVVLAAGEAGGTIDGTPWHTPAAWKAVTRDGKVMEWHVFADNKVVRDILAKRH
jgi:ketosteroid isomerase-like protein